MEGREGLVFSKSPLLLLQGYFLTLLNIEKPGRRIPRFASRVVPSTVSCIHRALS